MLKVKASRMMLHSAPMVGTALRLRVCNLIGKCVKSIYIMCIHMYIYIYLSLVKYTSFYTYTHVLGSFACFLVKLMLFNGKGILSGW